MVTERDVLDNEVSKAASEGNLPKLQRAIRQGGNPNGGKNARDCYGGSTPLMLASFNLYPDIVDALLSFPRVNVDEMGRGGSTALMCVASAYYKNIESEHADNLHKIVRSLLQKKADPNIRNNAGCTALHIAAANGDGTTVGILLNHGANPFLRDRMGKSAYNVAEETHHNEIAGRLRPLMQHPDILEFKRAVSRGNAHEIKYCLEAGADPNAIIDPASGLTILMLAVQSGHVENVRALMDYGADTYRSDKFARRARDFIAADCSWRMRGELEPRVSTKIPGVPRIFTSELGTGRRVFGELPTQPKEDVAAAERKPRPKPKPPGLRKYPSEWNNLVTPGMSTAALLRRK